LLAKVQQYAECRRRVCGESPREAEFTPHPATWFNGGRYDDDPKEWEPHAKPLRHGEIDPDDIDAQYKQFTGQP
jgi:hypothetical protein